ncbi:MAG: hypothetical protein B7Z73_06270 [Planctomycetia bacterium 21-64-5]|nr:MAG: hypothetical protein B7Z73_06270 [Planctomycetia bacterium 21-64-5]HQU44918.1 hypothetical protein [Pirellulales bacterium]HVA45872.1 hypothetical protein [Pirellulales bacterium]
MISLAPLLLATRIHDLWFALPLIVVVSLVYSATRHELPRPIAVGAVRMAAWISGFMLIGFAILFTVSSLL